MTHNSKSNIDPELDKDAFRKNITVRGLTGLRNVGNTCYINSAIQCISATPMLLSYVVKGKFKEDLKNNITEKIADKKTKELKLAEGTEIDIFVKDVNTEIKKSVVYNLYILLKEMWN